MDTIFIPWNMKPNLVGYSLNFNLEMARKPQKYVFLWLWNPNGLADIQSAVAFELVRKPDNHFRRTAITDFFRYLAIWG